MAEYRNDSKGARAVHLNTGNHVLVEPGATVTVESHRVKRLAPGLVQAAPDKKLPKPSAAAVKAVAGSKAKPRTRRAPAKRKAPAAAKA
jgi:hypothetical protein